uniref:Uncharacterized protein n=1 Tax=Rhizophora mucronata TaxID=61149 RepID=A0A2P2PHU7_RHIMU
MTIIIIATQALFSIQTEWRNLACMKTKRQHKFLLERKNRNRLGQNHAKKKKNLFCK